MNFIFQVFIVPACLVMCYYAICCLSDRVKELERRLDEIHPPTK